MATASPSRNPFADPNLPSLADMIERLKQDQRLPIRRRQNWIWAAKTIARAIGKNPADIIAHPEFLRTVMEKAAPASIGLTRASWNNARSLFGKALEWAGVASIPGHYLAPLNPLWAGLRQKLPPGKTTRAGTAQSSANCQVNR